MRNRDKKTLRLFHLMMMTPGILLLVSMHPLLARK